MEDCPPAYNSAGLDLYQSVIESLNNCHQQDTKGQYKSGLKKFKKWIIQTCPTLELPLSELDWCLYAQWLKTKEKHTPGTVKQYLEHVSFMLECLGHDKPKWKNMSKLRRLKVRNRGMILSKANKKQPVGWSLVKKIVDIVPEEDADANIFCATLTCGVAGFFRLGELLVKKKTKVKQERLIRAGHLKFFPNRAEPNHMSLFLPYSKTDIFGHGITIMIPCHPEPRYCPVRRMAHATRYLNATDPVFCWPSGMLMTKQSFIRKLRFHLAELGIDYKQYSGHSLRRGAAQSAKAAGAGPELIKLLGRWNSDAYKFYLHSVPSHVQQLNTTLSLMGLAQTG